MQEHGGALYNWYIGVTQDPAHRLFSAHNVQRTGIWIHSNKLSSEAARTVEKYFLDRGCDGGTGGGTHLARFVYAYKKTPYTNENN